jgi:LysR family transcriptional regulator, glycine cleavage system transcriptional activator
MNRARRPRLSLDLLKAFEAAARHVSFTRAARELFVTPSAVSRGIKTLEQQLERRLFIRVDRGLALTDAGRALQRAVSEALRTIDKATGSLGDAGVREGLTVTSNAATASLWLVPRLARFARRSPGVDLRVLATDKIVNIEREQVDVAIRHFQPESQPGGAEPPLMVERVFPVCAPALLRRQRLKSPADLARHVLLQFETYTAIGPWTDWTRWLEATKLGALVPGGVMRFSHYDQVVQAALDGCGVALGRHPLIARQLRAGSLVAPFGTAGVVSGYLHAMVSRGSEDKAAVRSFVQWLASEARREGSSSRRRPPAA